MEKRVIALFILSLLVLSLSVSMVSAEIEFWEGWKKQELSQDYAKILILVLVSAVVFAVLSTIKFPENGGLRLIIAVLVSFLSTLFITYEEIYGVFSSYTAVGIALSYFIPIVVLVALTISFTKRAGVVGIVFSKIAWLMFSVYALFKGLLVLLVDYYLKTVIEFEAITANTAKKIAAAAAQNIEIIKLDDGKVISQLIGHHHWFTNYILTNAQDFVNQAAIPSTITGIIMCVLGAAALYYGVINSGAWTDWLRKEVEDGKTDVWGSNLKNLTDLGTKASENVERANA